MNELKERASENRGTRIWVRSAEERDCRNRSLELDDERVRLLERSLFRCAIRSSRCQSPSLKVREELLNVPRTRERFVSRMNSFVSSQVVLTNEGSVAGRYTRYVSSR
jgi:hypothetical protein